MRRFVLAFAMTLSAATPAFAGHPASDYLKTTLDKAKAVLDQKSQSDRFRGMCSLMKKNLGVSYVAGKWLGEFINLDREKEAVREFAKMIPSILVSKAAGAFGNQDTGGATFIVSPDARERSPGYFEVSVTIMTNLAASYRGRAIVQSKDGGFKFVDIEYMGFSGVKYIGKDYLRFLNSEYNKNPNHSMPVTALIRQVEAEEGYQECP